MPKILKTTFKFMKWIFIFGLIFLACAIAIVAILNYSSGSRLAKKRAELSANSQPLSFAELKPKPVPPDQDAMVILRSKKEEIKALEMLVYKDLLDGPLSSEQHSQLATHCRNNSELLETLRNASKLPFANADFDFTAPKFMEDALSEPQKFRGPARVLLAESKYFLHQGEPNRALENATAILRWGRLASQQPAMIGFLVSIAIEGMAINAASAAIYSGANDSKQIQEIKQLLNEFESDKDWKHALTTERAYGQTLAANQFHPILRSMWFFSDWQVGFLDLLQAAQTGGHMTPSQFSDLIRSNDSGWMVITLQPALRVAHHAQLRNLAMGRSLRTLIAWSEGGRTANGISEVHLTKLQTLDPFNGISLQWQATDKGPVIYSVGENAIDDGGKIHDAFDIGIGPTDEQ